MGLVSLLNPLSTYASAIGLVVRIGILAVLGIVVFALLGDVGLLDGLARSLIGF